MCILTSCLDLFYEKLIYVPQGVLAEQLASLYSRQNHALYGINAILNSLNNLNNVHDY